MKSSKEIINDVIKKLQKKQNSHHYEFPQVKEGQLNPLELIPIHFTGMIEDYLFRQSREIFNILKEDTDHDIEGMTYKEISQDLHRAQYLQKVRQNIPKYYCLKPIQRQNYFKKVGQNYLQNLGIKPQTTRIQSYQSTPKKKSKNPRQITPIKSKKISKKQIKKDGKRLQKNTLKNKKILAQQAKNKKQNQQKKQESPMKCQTPKKKLKKTVKFDQFQYVKDFSQHKTPKKISKTDFSLQPVKLQKSINQQK